jgi:hypothetical protein
MCKRLLVLALVAMLSPVVLGDILVDDRFDDGDIGTNTMGIGTGFNAGTWSTGTAVTESGGTVTLENSEVGWARAAITSKEGAKLGTASAQYMFLGVTFSQSPNGWDWGGTTDRLALGVKGTDDATEYDAGLWAGFYVQMESDSMMTGVNSQFNGKSTLFYRSTSGVNTELASWSFDTLNWDDWANFSTTANFTPVLDLILELSPTGYSLTIVGDTITLLSGSLSNTYAAAGITNELTTGYAFAYAQTENPSLFTSVDQIIIMGVNPFNPGTEGLVAYYALDGDANDSSGNGLNGTLETIGGGNAATFVAGHNGMAMDFLPTANGTVGPYVNCGADPLFDFTDAVTVGAWVNFRSVPDEWRAIVTKGDNAWRLSNVGAGTAFQFSFAGYGVRPGNVYSADGTIEVGFDSWHYICGTYDKAVGASLYVDGVLDVMTPDTVGIALNTNDVWIGGNNGDTGWKPYRLFDGMIDEVRIYNRALSADEIAFLSK